jgi:hypothetical protein
LPLQFVADANDGYQEGKSTMDRHQRTENVRAALLGIAVLLGTTVSGAASAQDWGRGAEREDRKTCADYGLDIGSKEYARCMLTQQARRDEAPVRGAEQQRANAEAVRNNVETVRMIRCNREAKREHERGEQPRRCR